jgi:uncharacterized protein DUF547
MRVMNVRSRIGYCLAIVVLGLTTSAPVAQEASQLTGFDFILDTYVRDGYVYYRALKMDRKRLDGYLAQLAGVDAGKLAEKDRIAFWLNAYNALVLKTVVDSYPAPRRSSDYPPGSIRQTPGAFERLTHRVGGRTLTLDQIEQTVLPDFGDPRLYFALGRGSVGGGRLRSESFTGEALERQLVEVASECVTRAECIQIDAATNRLMASPIFSWREKDFVDAYAAAAAPIYQARSPVERAILGFVRPKLLQTERDFLEKNTFEVAYKPFDWTLNDLTGRGDR